MIFVSISIVALDQEENFLQFLDPDLCQVEETAEKSGIRALDFKYQFQDLTEDKELFKKGNKIWISGDKHIADCLYVINTNVEIDVYNEHLFSFEIEEVLVELNNAPLASQLDLDAKSSNNVNVFNIVKTNGKEEVVINWNALNYWFGNYYNIGVVQKCLNDYAGRIVFTGSMTLMSLLRYIEEETGNVFVTRYEKDVLNNTIHRYLDFLNPLNVNRDWELNLMYDFINIEDIVLYFDANDDLCTVPPSWEDTPFDDEGNELPSQYEAEDDIDYDEEADYTPIININPSYLELRITDGENVLNTDGTLVKNDGGTPLIWTAEEAGLTDNDPSIAIQLAKIKNKFCVTTNVRSMAVAAGVGAESKSFIETLTSIADVEDSEYDKNMLSIPDDMYFELYDTNYDKTVFRTCLNTQIGHVHNEILDFGFNIENVTFETDESNVYSAAAPVLSTKDNITKDDMKDILTAFYNLSIKKGDYIPMIIEKVNVTGRNWSDAAAKLGTSNPEDNYWNVPCKPSNQINESGQDSTYEFFRATAYWRAPFDKPEKQLHIRNDSVTGLEYINVFGRPDSRREKGTFIENKIGTTETSEEDKYAIYNAVALYLKEHQTKEFNIKVDVANLRGHEFNNYDLHDKVYVKLPETDNIVTARVVKTTKNIHDIAKNTVELSNYTTNHVKNIQNNTFMEIYGDRKFDYPSKKKLTIRLVNEDHDSEDEYSIQYPPLKLITFSLYRMDNGSATFKKTYTKTTDANGYATITMSYDPGTYQIKISFYGDEEFNEYSDTVDISVGGTKEVAKKTTSKTKTKSKTTKKSKKKKVKYKTVKQYWTKCGKSPDKKHKELVAIAKPSGPDAGKYSYKLYKTVFKNKCPICGKVGTLAFDGGSANKCITSAGAYGRGYKIGVPEHEITCNACDSDFCGVTGAEKWYTIRGRIQTIKKPVASSQAEFNKLVKGKLVYGTKKVKVKAKKTTSTKNKKRKIKGNPSKFVRNKALDIVKDKIGHAALRAIVSWMDKNIWYKGYPNFHRSAEAVLKEKSGNCCDQTRCFFELCDAAGLTEYYTFCYVHVYGHVYSKVTSKKTGKWLYIDPASDTHTAWGYVCQGYAHGGCTTTYPTKPF